jgi:hypothetical protein
MIQLRRTPAFTVSAVLTLVIGLGASVAIFAVVNGVLLRPLPYGDPQRLVGIWHDLPGVSMSKANQTSGTYFTYQRFARSIESIGLSQQGAVNLAAPGGDGEPQRVASASITASLIPTLQVSPLLGRNFLDSEDVRNGPAVVIIGEQLWRTRYGADSAIIGRMVEVNGRRGNRRRDAARFRDPPRTTGSGRQRSQRHVFRRIQLEVWAACRAWAWRARRDLRRPAARRRVPRTSRRAFDGLLDQASPVRC